MSGSYKIAKARGVASEFMRAYNALMRYLDDERCAAVHRWFIQAAQPVRDARSIWEHRRNNRLVEALADLVDTVEEARGLPIPEIASWYGTQRSAALFAVESATAKLRSIIDAAEGGRDEVDEA